MNLMSTEAVVINEPSAMVAREVNPLDASPVAFRAALVRRGDNRKSLIDWIREALVDGTDFGKIHTKNKRECKHNGPPYCTPELEPYHWSKPTLRKPGAEKICGMLGVNATFPTLQDYEARALEGLEINSIIIRCRLLTADDRVVAHGVGARNVSQDYGDLNKALKMCLKSAHIDATLRMAGLSEIFTQDLEDMPPAQFGGDSGGDQQHEAPASNDARSNNSGPAPGQQSQAPRTNGNAGGGRCTERQARLVGVKLDQAGIPENEFLKKFGIAALPELPFARVNEALQYISEIAAS
jgi:hypothetical protein